MIQGLTDPNDTFKLHFDIIYENMDLAGGDNILCSKQLAKNCNQASTNYKQVQTCKMNSMCFLLSADYNRYKSPIYASEGRG